MKKPTIVLVCLVPLMGAVTASATFGQIGSELSIPVHIQNGQEFRMGIDDLFAAGSALFQAMWTAQEGGGRPLTKGNGKPLADPTTPLVFPRNFNRVSAPDANSCSGCHNKPFSGGGGDIVANVFVLGQRFDFATFDPADFLRTRGTVDESGATTRLQTIANSRKSVGMNGSGFIEMLARQITTDLQAIRGRLGAGQSAPLVSKGVSFGMLSRDVSGNWEVSQVYGLPAPSLKTTGPADPPNLIVRPFHQAGAVVSLREFSNNAFNHHHGIQSEERFGSGVDADGDGFVNEMTVADITAVSIYQAGLPVPGRVIPRDRTIEAAIANGEVQFNRVGCAGCHVPRLPLNDQGWMFSEPNPFNPAGNLNSGRSLVVDLTSRRFPGPRLKDSKGVLWVPAYTDLKLHDLVTPGMNDADREPLDMTQPAGSAAFFAGNSKFLTRKLWGIANQHSFGHHGLYSTMREAINAHNGEALSVKTAFLALSSYDQGSIIEFLKSLQTLPQGATTLCVDERGRPRNCPSGVWAQAEREMIEGHDRDDRYDRYDR